MRGGTAKTTDFMILCNDTWMGSCAKPFQRARICCKLVVITISDNCFPKALVFVAVSDARISNEQKQTYRALQAAVHPRLFCE